MVGSELPSPSTESSTVTDEVLLEVEHLTLPSAEGRPLLDDVSLTIHRGEVLGVAGVEGNGQAELVEAIMGMRAGVTGELRLGGTTLTGRSTRERREAGVGYIPEDRHRHGLLLDSPLWENRVLGHQTSRPSARGGLDRPPGRPGGHRADHRGVRRPDARPRRPGPGAVRRQPAEADRGPGDERRARAADRGPPHPRRRRRRPGSDLGPRADSAARRPRGAADLGRPRRADRPLRPDRGDPARAARRHLRPARP